MKKVIGILFGVVLWATIGFFNYGYTLGFFTNKFPDQRNVGPAILTAIAGPFAVPAVYLVGNSDHWLLKPYTKEQCWKAFQHMYPNLDREYFERTY